ncbi:sulfurtransferase TusA family protein [Reinekea blandensis]|uniref:sulfurtransferase TusA family protein n=1 Tax=Reinekea blandensis TaxID=374838 RepID=UPI00058C81EB|nr:sulfurtransferase TusA family protein [Reinekea blandensis]
MTQILVDASELRCPLPLLKLKQALAQVQIGDEVVLLATDAGSCRDVPAFVALTAHQLISQQETDGQYRFAVQKGE